MQPRPRRLTLASAVPAIPFLCVLTHSALAAPVSSTDYNTQRTALKAARVSSFSEVQALGRNALGKTVEIAGEVKGVITRGTGYGVLFRGPDGQTVMLDGPEHLRNSLALSLGSNPRILARVDAVMGNEVVFTMVNATTEPENSASYRPQDNDPGAPVILTPMTGGTMVPQASRTWNNPAPSSSKSPQNLSASSLRPPVANQLTPPAGPQVLPDAGVDPDQRQMFKSLARRFNPRLDENMADYISTAILSASSAQNLDPRFLAAVVSVESSFDPTCVSSSGAMGLGQIMPFNLKGLGISNAWDPMQNLHGSARMLRNNLNRFAGQDNPTLLAVAAYHAGGNAVARAGNQVPNKAATQKYVWKVYYAYKALAPELFNN